MIGDEINREIQRLTAVYTDRVRSARTRRVLLFGRKCRPRIQYTFLGFELKAGNKRLTCPDLTTARYLKVFAELGLRFVEIPYDPTCTAGLLPELEDSFQRLKDLLLELRPDEKSYALAERRLFARIRRRL